MSSSSADQPPLLSPKSANLSVLRDNHTSQYTPFNSMATPKLCPLTSTPKLGDISKNCLIDYPITNADRYTFGYPIGGKVLDAQDAGSDGDVADNGFYQGPDLSLGSNYFLDLGQCGPDSVPECVGQNRAVYVRNITTGSIPLIGGLSLAKMTGTNSGVMASNGILPGTLDVGVSAFAPQNIVANVFEKEGNFGGASCRRIRLPVGAHIYDSKMKAVLDYSKINACNADGSPPDTYTRNYRAQQQVNQWLRGTDPSTGAATNPRSWWYEEKCTPSYHWAVEPATPLDADTANHESTYLPSAHPLVDIEPTYDIPTMPESSTCIEGFRTLPTNAPTHKTMGRWWALVVVCLLALAMVLMVCKR